MDPESVEFIRTIENHFRSRNYELAKFEVMNPVNLRHTLDDGMELISVVCDVGLELATEADEVLECSELLNHICSRYSPKLALVSTLEQVSSSFPVWLWI